MANSTKKSFAVQLAEANNTVQAKGLVLSQWDKSITRGDVNRFKALCAKDGFWFSLGEICLELLKQSGGKKTDSALLKDANLHTVAKQRRSEAMKFFENFHVIVENDLLGKKSTICHMKDLLKEVDKIVNPKVEKEPKVPVEPKAPVLAVEDKSSVEPKAPLSASDIALEALVQCELNGVSKAKFLAALKEQLEMLDDSTDKSVIKAAA
jgi:hypothetical protein|tara:strand:+ start:859 stop:1485 length:627 start_codon:yes stop_codon:yes gene_type:complete